MALRHVSTKLSMKGEKSLLLFIWCLNTKEKREEAPPALSLGLPTSDLSQGIHFWGGVRWDWVQAWLLHPALHQGPHGYFRGPKNLLNIRKKNKFSGHREHTGIYLSLSQLSYKVVPIFFIEKKVNSTLTLVFNPSFWSTLWPSGPKWAMRWGAVAMGACLSVTHLPYELDLTNWNENPSLAVALSTPKLALMPWAI